MNFLFRSVQFGLMHIWPIMVLALAAFFLDAAEVGAVAIIVSFATLFRPLVGLSLGRTAIRYVGEVASADGESAGKQVAAVAARLGMLVSLVSALVIAIALPLVAQAYDVAMTMGGMVSAILFCYLFGITEFLDGLLRAQGKFKKLAIAVSISRIVGAFCFLIGLFIWPSLTLLFVVLAFSELVCIALLGSDLLSSLKQPVDKGNKSLFTSKLLKYCIPVVINAVAVYFYARAMVMIAGLYDTPANLGGFELAVQLTTLPMAITIVSGSVLSPVVSRLYSQGAAGRDKVSEVVSYASSFAVCTGFLSAVFFGVVAPFFIYWLFPELNFAAQVLMIVSPLLAIKAYAQILSGEVSVSTGSAHTGAVITLVFSVITVLLGVMFASRYGVLGAAWAMVIAHSGAAAATVYFLGEKIGLKLKYRTLSSLILSVVVGLPTALSVYLLKDHEMLAALVGSLVFVVAMLAAVLVSSRLGLGLEEGLKDGWRMIKSKSAGQIETVILLDDLVPNASNEPAARREALLLLIKDRSPAAYAYWFGGSGDFSACGLQDHADTVYSAYLLGAGERLSKKSAQDFCVNLQRLPLYGKAEKGLNAHLTAYLLSTLRVLQSLGLVGVQERLYEGFRKELLIDDRDVPRWPWAWTHHSWRVSHWIGGAPSILLHLAESGQVEWADRSLVENVLKACEKHILDSRTGLLRPYKSQLLQNAFRMLYRLRHDPEIADLGGVVHLLWIYHAMDRVYVGNAWLDAAADKQLTMTPFMEEVPYCLDFDILQLKRTALVAGLDESARLRGQQFVDDCISFFNGPISSKFTLHKLPGALASMHEAQMLAGKSAVKGLEIPTVDIIKKAFWL